MYKRRRGFVLASPLARNRRVTSSHGLELRRYARWWSPAWCRRDRRQPHKSSGRPTRPRLLPEPAAPSP